MKGQFRRDACLNFPVGLRDIPAFCSYVLSERDSARRKALHFLYHSRPLALNFCWKPPQVTNLRDRGF